MNSKHAYDMVVADLTDSIENSEQTIEEKKITKARKEEKAATNKKVEASTQAAKKEDEKTLADMQVECKDYTVNHLEVVIMYSRSSRLLF